MEILLKNAINLAERAKRENDATDAAIASAYAAIATAEAMQLLCRRLEQFMDAQGVGPDPYPPSARAGMIEAAERGLRYQAENERLLRRIAVLEGEPVESEYEPDA